MNRRGADRAHSFSYPGTWDLLPADDWRPPPERRSLSPKCRRLIKISCSPQMAWDSCSH